MLYKKNICFLLFTLCVFFVQIGSAQEVTVINQKGTKIKVVNNKVTTSATAPTNPFENDVWFDSSTTPSTIKIYDGTAWLIMEHKGTQGSVFYAGANGLPTENNSQLFWDSANNRFGVGTNSPTNKLEVSGAIGAQGILNSNGTVGEPSFRFKDDTNTGIYRPAADELGFSVGGIEAMKIDEPTTGNTVVVVNQTLELQGKLLDINNSEGTNGQILSSTATGTQWVNAAPAQTTTTITNTVTGHKIANYTNEASTNTPINETITSLSQDDSSATGEITFKDEAGGTTGKAQVVSANTDNQIKVGTDGGAYFSNLPTVVPKTASYALVASDNGKVFTFSSSTDVILTVPTGLPIGFNVSIYQIGAGTVTVSGGTTILNRLSRFKTAGLSAGAGLIITATNTAHLTGDLKR